jgi:transposase
MTAETLRSWIRQHQVDDGQRDGVSSETAAEIRALKRRNAELEQTIEILKAATSFFFLRAGDASASRAYAVWKQVAQWRKRSTGAPMNWRLCLPARSPAIRVRRR